MLFWESKAALSLYSFVHDFKPCAYFMVKGRRCVQKLNAFSDGSKARVGSVGQSKTAVHLFCYFMPLCLMLILAVKTYMFIYTYRCIYKVLVQFCAYFCFFYSCTSSGSCALLFEAGQLFRGLSWAENKKLHLQSAQYTVFKAKVQFSANVCFCTSALWIILEVKTRNCI